MSTLAYWGCPLRDAPFSVVPFFVVRGSPPEPQPARAVRQRSGTTTFHTKITRFGYTRFWNPYYNTVTGPGLPLFPPPRNGGPAFFFALFTRVPRREILRTSY